jgi:hypothetical protein
MQLKTITAITVLLLVVAALLVSGSTVQTTPSLQNQEGSVSTAYPAAGAHN